MANLHLPEDLMDEILLRSSVVSLARFKSVSHAWHTRICSPAFAKSYRKHNNNKPKKAMIYTSVREPLFYSLSLNGTKNEVERVPHKFSHSGEKDGFRIVGSCDGILLVLSYDPFNLCMWNPSLREYKNLPGSIDIDPQAGIRYGFGRASSSGKENNDNYKVLYLKKLDSISSTSKVLLYTTRTNSWKILKDIPYSIQNYSGVLVNTKLHYLISKRYNSSDVLLAFDINGEEFAEVPEPKYADGYCLSMVDLNGDLCVAYQGVGGLDLWVMKEYGMEESWTNMFCIKIDSIQDLGGRGSFYVTPLRCFEDGQILLQAYIALNNHYSMVYYDSDIQQARIPILDGVPRNYDTIIYDESLNSPNANECDYKTWPLDADDPSIQEQRKARGLSL